jgi:predicted RNase H-like HicB family nuclease
MGDEMTVSPYQVSLSQKDGIWLLEAVGLQGVRSFGRTVSAAVVNMRQAIAESEEVDGSDVLELVFVIDDADVSVFLDRLREANEERKKPLWRVAGRLKTRSRRYECMACPIGTSAALQGCPISGWPRLAQQAGE